MYLQGNFLQIRRPRPSPRPGRRLGPPQVWNFSARALNVRGSFHQAWPSAFAAPGLQPALCLHIPRGSFHQAPGRQRSSIAACPLPAHSPLLLGHSSLPFARLQTPKTPKTLQFLRGSFHQAWPSAFAAPGLQPALCLHIPRGSFHQAPGRQRSSIAACPLPAHSLLLLGQCFAAEVLPHCHLFLRQAQSFYFMAFFSLPFCRERANVSSGIVFPRA